MPISFTDTATTPIYTLSLHDALPISGCNLSQGIFTDTQSLSAQIDAANDSSAQGLDSFNTFQVGFTSDLPFISADGRTRSEEHTSELQSQSNLVCRLLLEKKKKKIKQ